MGDHKNFSELPPIVELAARVRAGEKIPTLAAELNVSPTTIYNRFNMSGFTTAGETKRDEARRQLKDHLASAVRSWSEPWMSEGICGQTDPEAFFPEKGGSTAEAKRVCMGCPVRGTCLEWALGNNERFGIFGGKSERERRKIAKERQAAA